MDERYLVLLRRKLEALNYTERLEAASAPLVAKLVKDLVKTTDSYRSVKLQASKYVQEISTFNTKVRRCGECVVPLQSARRCSNWIGCVLARCSRPCPAAMHLPNPPASWESPAPAFQTRPPVAADSSTSSSRTAAASPTRTARCTRSSSRPASATRRCSGRGTPRASGWRTGWRSSATGRSRRWGGES